MSTVFVKKTFTYDLYVSSTSDFDEKLISTCIKGVIFLNSSIPKIVFKFISYVFCLGENHSNRFNFKDSVESINTFCISFVSYHPAFKSTLAAGIDFDSYFSSSAVYQPAKIKPSFSGVGNVIAVPASCEISLTSVPPFSSNTSIACHTAFSCAPPAGILVMFASSPLIVSQCRNL